MIERSASLPTRVMSSPRHAMSTMSVDASSGTIRDLIARRKMFDNSWRSDASNPFCPAGRAGNRYPIATPAIMATTIHCVWERRRRPVRGGVGAAAEMTAFIGSTEGGLGLAGAPKRGMLVAVREIQYEADQQPDAEPNPGLEG